MWTAQPLESGPGETLIHLQTQSHGSAGGAQHPQFPNKPFLWSMWLLDVVTDAVPGAAQVF